MLILFRLFSFNSLIRLGDYARDLSDQISAQAAMAVQHMIPPPSRARNSPSFPRQSVARKEELEQTESTQKRGIMRVPIGRETEGDEKDIEVFEPQTVNKPEMTDSDEDTWLRPLVPFSFSFGLLTPWWEG